MIQLVGDLLQRTAEPLLHQQVGRLVKLGGFGGVDVEIGRDVVHAFGEPLERQVRDVVYARQRQVQHVHRPVLGGLELHVPAVEQLVALLAQGGGVGVV